MPDDTFIETTPARVIVVGPMVKYCADCKHDVKTHKKGGCLELSCGCFNPFGEHQEVPYILRKYKRGDIVIIKLPTVECGVDIEDSTTGRKRSMHDRIYHNQLGVVVTYKEYEEGNENPHIFTVATLMHKQYKDLYSIGSDFAEDELEPSGRTYITANELNCVKMFCEHTGLQMPKINASLA